MGKERRFSDENLNQKSNKERIITDTVEFVKGKLLGEGRVDAWWHTVRVHRLAKEIGEESGADICVVMLAALLHEVYNLELQSSQEVPVDIVIARQWLDSQGVDTEVVEQVSGIIVENLKAGSGDRSSTFEGQAFQDAHNLDSMGAIGIGRAKYSKIEPNAIIPLYEKSLMLKRGMNTEAGRKLAEPRHQFMEEFLEAFLDECEA